MRAWISPRGVSRLSVPDGVCALGVQRIRPVQLPFDVCQTLFAIDLQLQLIGISHVRIESLLLFARQRSPACLIEDATGIIDELGPLLSKLDNGAERNGCEQKRITLNDVSEYEKG